MSRIESLLRAYQRFVTQPWQAGLSGAERVWFAVYDPSQERRLLFRLSEFETATIAAHHRWQMLDMSQTFGDWMAAHRYREAYFDDPEALGLALPDYAQWLSQRIRDGLTSGDIDTETVFALVGAGSLFGLLRTATLVDSVADAIPGRLLVFFPGSYEGAQYRLFDARDGWNYLAVPITSEGGG